jgi:hypothetical protein
MRMIFAWVAAIALSTGAAGATVDAAGELNDLIARTLAAARVPLPDQARTFVIAHIAMFDAVNAVEGSRYAAYGTPPAPPAGASASAAGLGAVCAVLNAYHKEHEAAVDKQCNAVAATLQIERKSAATQYGETIGRLLVEARGQGDTANGYRPATTAGVYVPTTLPIGWDSLATTPFAMREVSQFRPRPPPPLASATWARDYNETKRIGGRKSTERSDEQTGVARFWATSGITIYNPLIRQMAGAAGTTLSDQARVYALAYIALADAGIAVFDAKYEYNFWRPLTAIRNGDIDGNDATERDAEWMPLIDAPMHPEYPCAHCITAAALGEVMKQVLGDGEFASSLGMSAPTGPDTPKRSWTRASDFVAELGNSRLWAGIHYRTSIEVGAAMGKQVGRYVLETTLKPR